MTRTNRNRLLAILLAAIPVLSYSYFVSDFLSRNSDDETIDNQLSHRYRIGQQTVQPQLNPSDQR